MSFTQKCDICNKTNEGYLENDVFVYGEWMVKQDVTVHYFCLLLSTNLVQRGCDSSGILGFLMRDIRQEITDAQRRICVYCCSKGASVMCHTCNVAFHVECGLRNRCVTYYCDDYRSYCERCVPLDDYQRQLIANPPEDTYCTICLNIISIFVLTRVTYGDCCRRGFAHRSCMSRYAAASGYYLQCLWCRSKKFRDTIKLQTIFVPDRDATWELQPDAYRELHYNLRQCDQAICECPSGRKYNRNSWILQVCVLCASTGVHSRCRVDLPQGANAANPPDYKCEECISIEQKLNESKIVVRRSNTESTSKTGEQIDESFYVTKRQDSSIVPDEEQSIMSNDASIVTVIASQRQTILDNGRQSIAAAPDQIIELPDSQQMDRIIDGTDTLKPPLLLCKSYTTGSHFYLVVYEFVAHLAKPCIGTCTLRFDLNDERLKDKSETALQQICVTERDIWFRDSNTGVYGKIDQLMGQHSNTQ